MRWCPDVMRNGRGLARIAAAALASLAFVGAAGAAVLANSGTRGQRGVVALEGSPGFSVADSKTHTLYVPIQCRDGQRCRSTAEHIVDIIDTSHCHAGELVGCRVVGRARVGKLPLAAVLDQATDTVYVIEASGAVSVIDGKRCNASVRTNCAARASIRTGGFDVAGALDPRTHTLYVAALSGDVFVVDVAQCNAHTTRGCRHLVRTVKDPRGPDAVDVDVATGTVYVADSAKDNSGHTVSVINGARCNGAIGAGCAGKPRRIGVGTAPFWITVDQAANTIYTANDEDGTVSVINGASCNARVTSGCAQRTRSVQTGAGPGYVAIDRSRHTLFTINQGDDTMSELDVNTCNGHRQSGCPVRARNARVPWNPPQGYNPGSFTIVPSTGTAYVVNPGGESYLAVISIKGCNARTTKDCRVEAPTVPSRPLFFPVLDQATDTIYTANANGPGIKVVDAATCDIAKRSRAGCAAVATIPFPHPDANLGSIDAVTHTLYAADTFANTVYAIDIQHCNAHDTSGCSVKPGKMTIGSYSSPPVLDQVTHTLYVPEGSKTKNGYSFNQIAVLNSATCNGQVRSGCGQKPGTITVGNYTFFLAMDQSTDTLYAPESGPSYNGRRIWVISGATCNASVRSGCGHVAAKVKVAPGPAGLGIDTATHTLYVAANGDGDLPGRVTIINTATCNGSHTSGCTRTFPTVPVERSPAQLVVDQHANRIYVSDFASAAVSIIDGARCNAMRPAGCGSRAQTRNVGSQPNGVAVDNKTKTVYVGVDVLYRGQPDHGLSLFRTIP